MTNTEQCQFPISAQCNVELDTRPLFTWHQAEINEVPDKVALYSTEGNYLSTVSKRSANNLRTYDEFATMLSDGVTGGNLNLDGVTCEDNIWNDGKRFSRLMTFPHHTFNFLHEDYQLQLWSWTAYDLSWAEQFIFGPLNIVCLNGQFSADWKIKGMSKKNWNQKASVHSSDINTAISSFNNYPEQLESMANATVTHDDVKHLFEKTLAEIEDNINPRVSDYRMRQLSDLWSTYERKFGRNLYAVYQAATDWASNPKGKGMKMNMVRSRSQQVVDMCKTDNWLALCNHEVKKVYGLAPREVLEAVSL